MEQVLILIHPKSGVGIAPGPPGSTGPACAISRILDINEYYIVDVLWCQPIKLIHVVSTSEFHEY